MKKNILSIAALSLLCMGLASCSDDELPYSEAQVTNTELRTILEKQGIQFDETGHMLLDDKVQNLTKLDLTGTKFTDFNSLTILPNLNELDLSDNEFGPAFDFSTLPAQITGVDLTGNEIYDFEGLVKVEFPEDGGDTKVTNLREIKKLHIPATMKDNFDDMVYFYSQNKAAINDKTMDVQMADEKGNLATYTTLRNIPDAELVKYFKHEFPAVMVGEQIDMAAYMPMEQATKALSVSAVGTGDVYEVDVMDFEGVQYLANNPNWNGAVVSLTGLANPDYSPKSVMPKFPIKESVTKVFFTFVSGEIDFSKASNLAQIMITSNNGLTEIDLNGATLWGTRAAETELGNTYGSAIMVSMCSNLEKVVMPEAKDLKCFCYGFEICPKLKALDMSHLNMVGFGGYILAELADNCKLTYPNLTLYEKDGFIETNFACSTNVWNVQATKDFLTKYYTKIEDPSKRIQKGYTMNSMDDFDWESELSL